MDGAAAPGPSPTRAPPRVEGGISGRGEFSFVALSPLTMTPPGDDPSSAANEIAPAALLGLRTRKSGADGPRGHDLGAVDGFRRRILEAKRLRPGAERLISRGSPMGRETPKREGNETETAI